MTAFSLKSKIAIVTGGASGIGEAISKTFATQGAHVHILEFNTENGERVVKDIRSNGGKATFHSCDVAHQKQVAAIISAVAEIGRIDILVNNAGIAHVGNLEGTTASDLDRLYHVNIKGVYNCMHAVIGKMKAQGGGVILNMASIAATVGISDRFAYSMTKGAVLTMTYSVAKDYLNFGIRCNSISPARVHTPFVDGFIKKNYEGKEEEMFAKLSKSQPIGRMGTPDEVAHLALYLSSDEAAFITGTDFPIDGGYIKLNG
ncbi:SDR family oxidoreductase [Arenibacter sp. GZD96]|uniref:SDR family NAD(P)-dependent oxidoreductase n=1 Tax=Aurantibrevibacter litoralis TaxID=3106030 RepID=UPI002AFF6254|nr:SDR family oxidoreductase [Arenibacter sp. GZD-96]MEA1786990.1 SDR family oxidoreductase [Arenibacter sp. GZD-96]